MSLPLRCTSNVYGNIDYGIPILFKQTDYRTSTGTSHRHIPEVPQQFTKSIKSNLPPVSSVHDQRIKDYCCATIYNQEFYRKQVDVGAENSCPKANSYTKIHCIREVEEKIFNNPPKLMSSKSSKYKEEYYQKPAINECRIVFPPNPYNVCRLCSPYDSPSLDPTKAGFMKWLDPYLSTNRTTYIPHSVDRRNQFLYPKVGTLAGTGEQMCQVQEEPIYDKMVFKNPIKNRIVHAPPATLSVSKCSEYSRSYVPQTWSDYYTKIQGFETEFPDALPRSSAWQDLCAPGMYCTEQCHLGTGWPVAAVVSPLSDRNPVLNFRPHDPCNVKCCQKE